MNFLDALHCGGAQGTQYRGFLLRINPSSFFQLVGKASPKNMANKQDTAKSLVNNASVVNASESL